jgi:DNA-binding SARP family transcriptional activator/pimeloyl-ACP methyl ester carboxylesterase
VPVATVPPVPIRVLGPAEVVGPAGPVPGLERKARELLTVLGLRAPDAIGVDELAELLWDQPPPSATKTVQAHVSRIRAALAAAGTPAVVARAGAGGYALRAEPGALDVGEVARLRADARAERAAGRPDAAARLLGDARAAWRGDVELPATVAASGLAARWEHEQRLLVTEHLEAIVAGASPGDAVPELQALTAADPVAEPLWALLVTALHRTGATAAALRAYQAARSALADVGLEPGPVLRTAEAAVLDPAPPVVPAATATRPARPGVEAVAVRYVDVGGRAVAFGVLGTGPVDVLLLTPGVVSIDAIHEERHIAAAVARVAAGARVVVLDRGGIGLSDPLPGDRAPALDDWVADAVAVLDAVGSERPVVLANADTCLVALALAAAHPDRVRALVLVHGYARFERSTDYPWGFDPDTSRAISADVLALEPRPERFDPLSHIAPSVAGDPVFRRWWDAAGRRAASPATATALHALIRVADVRELLPRVAAPVLVLHRRSCTSCDVGHARHLVEHLPDARLVLLPGADDLWFTGDVDALLDAVDTFVAALPG